MIFPLQHHRRFSAVLYFGLLVFFTPQAMASSNTLNSLNTINPLSPTRTMSMEEIANEKYRLGELKIHRADEGKGRIEKIEFPFGQTIEYHYAEGSDDPIAKTYSGFENPRWNQRHDLINPKIDPRELDVALLLDAIEKAEAAPSIEDYIEFSAAHSGEPRLDIALTTWVIHWRRDNMHRANEEYEAHYRKSGNVELARKRTTSFLDNGMKEAFAAIVNGLPKAKKSKEKCKLVGSHKEGIKASGCKKEDAGKQAEFEKMIENALFKEVERISETATQNLQRDLFANLQPVEKDSSSPNGPLAFLRQLPENCSESIWSDELRRYQDRGGFFTVPLEFSEGYFGRHFEALVPSFPIDERTYGDIRFPIVLSQKWLDWKNFTTNDLPRNEQDENTGLLYYEAQEHYGDLSFDPLRDLYPVDYEPSAEDIAEFNFKHEFAHTLQYENLNGRAKALALKEALISGAAGSVYPFLSGESLETANRVLFRVNSVFERSATFFAIVTSCL